MSASMDALDAGELCPRCGIAAANGKDPMMCIEALRDRLALSEFQHAGQQPRPRQAARPVSPEGRLRAHDLPRFIAG
jgi:hypothetical protein